MGHAVRNKRNEYQTSFARFEVSLINIETRYFAERLNDAADIKKITISFHENVKPFCLKSTKLVTRLIP